jgi:hypothetical protein
MAYEFEVTGVMRGKKIIELDEEILLPDGSPVRLRLVLDSGHGCQPSEEPSTHADAEAEKTLQTIYQMRHQGRSIQRP